MRRDLTFGAMVGLTLYATAPAYDRVFVDDGWRTPALVAGAIALLLAVIVRRTGGGGFLSALISGAAAFSLMPWILGLATGPRLPTPTLLGELPPLFAMALNQLAFTPAPAEPLLGLVLLLVVGWWAIAHLAHEFAVRWHRPGLSLVVISVLWAAPLAIPMPGPPTPSARWFLAAGVLFLLVTAADRWRPGPTRTSTTDTDKATGTSRTRWLGVAHHLLPGALIGSVAVLVATSATGLLPGYGAPAWIEMQSGEGGRGYQPIVDVSQRLQLPEARDVLRVRSSQRTYLRLAGLDSFDGSTWRLGSPHDAVHTFDPASLTSARSRRLPPEAPAATVEHLDTSIEVLALENVYVPVPYQPVAVRGSIGDDLVWSTDGGVLVTKQVVAGTDGQRRTGIREGVDYRVTAERPAPTFETLRQMDTADYPLGGLTELPRDYPELRAQAAQVYADADAQSVIEQVLALQDWFVGPQGGFTYDLDVAPLRDEHALTSFVLDDRVGYCEHFATGMAVMLRTTGIPARVAVGFLPGRVTDPAPADGDGVAEYTVSTTDAHAWVEVLFPGQGWIAFEPTPRSDDTHMVPHANDLTPTENEAERRAREAAEVAHDSLPPPATPDDPAPTEAEEDESDLAAEIPAGVGAGPAQRAGWLIAAVVLVIVLITAALAWQRRRRVPNQRRQDPPDPRERVLRAQRTLLTAAASYGTPRHAHETVHEAVTRWHDDGRLADQWCPVAEVMQSVSFGTPTDATTARDIERATIRLVAHLRASAALTDRILAPLRRLKIAVWDPAHGVLRARELVSRARRAERTPGGRVRSPR